MLEFEVEIEPDLVCELATRLMTAWPGLEITTLEKNACFTLPVDERIDGRLHQFEETLQALERAKGLEPLTVRTRNTLGPDSAPEILQRGRFLIIRPGVKISSKPEQIILTIEAGPAFGTGGHPSTSLALQALEEYFCPVFPIKPAVRVLDVGTGSGILALAAAKLGAASVSAVDPLPEAVDSARRNAALNGLNSNLTITRTSAEKVTGEFDLITANLLPSVLLKAGAKLPRLLAIEGTMIAAGFSDQQTPQVVKLMTKAGLIIKKSYSQAGWTALVLNRPIEDPALE